MTAQPKYAHLLGLCPLLAVSHKLVYGLCLGLCTAVVMILSGIIGPRIAARFPSAARLVVHMLVIGALVIAIEIALQAFFYSLYQILGLFVPLIITNCAILAHCEQASGQRSGLGASIKASARAGGGFIVILVGVSLLRELLGHGTLLDDIELFLGRGAEWMTIDLGALYDGVPVALLPCGGFFALAVVVAAINARARTRQASHRVSEATLSYHARR